MKRAEPPPQATPLIASWAEWRADPATSLARPDVGQNPERKGDVDLWARVAVDAVLILALVARPFDRVVVLARAHRVGSGHVRLGVDGRHFVAVEKDGPRRHVWVDLDRDHLLVAHAELVDVLAHDRTGGDSLTSVGRACDQPERSGRSARHHFLVYFVGLLRVHHDPGGTGASRVPEGVQYRVDLDDASRVVAR